MFAITAEVYVYSFFTCSSAVVNWADIRRLDWIFVICVCLSPSFSVCVCEYYIVYTQLIASNFTNFQYTKIDSSLCLFIFALHSIHGKYDLPFNKHIIIYITFTIWNFLLHCKSYSMLLLLSLLWVCVCVILFLSSLFWWWGCRCLIQYAFSPTVYTSIQRRESTHLNECTPQLLMVLQLISRVYIEGLQMIQTKK